LVVRIAYFFLFCASYKKCHYFEGGIAMSAYAGQQGNAMTSKELNDLADHVKNEALLAQLCERASRECGNRELAALFTRQAGEHLQRLGELSGIVQKYAAH
jgi:hypothetical protein